MTNMFREVRSFNGDISKWNMSSVKDMSLMFFGATSFDGDLLVQVGRVERERYE